MVYGLDKMVYGLRWFEKTAIKWSTGDKMVYGLPSLDKTAIDLDKTAIGGDKMVYGLPWGDKIVYGR